MGLFGGMIDGYESSLKQKRELADQAFAEQQRKQQQEQWVREAALRAEMERQAAAAEQEYGQPQQSPDVFKQYGIKRTQLPGSDMANIPPEVLAQVRRHGRQDTPDAPTDISAPAPQAIAPPQGGGQADYMAMQKSSLLRQLKRAQMAGDRKTFESVEDQLRKLMWDQKSAQMSAQIMGMSDDELGQLADKVTNNPNNQYKMVVGKNGYTTIELDGTRKKLDRNELAQFIPALMRLNQGDASAMADLSKIDERLAAKAKEQLSGFKDVAGVNNTANHFGKVDDNNAANLGVNRARLGIERDRAAIDRMGKAEYFTDKDGNLRAGIPTVGKNGVSYQAIELPEGWKRDTGKTLTDQEKIAYSHLVKEILPTLQGQPPAAIEQAYRSVGLDPRKFGVSSPVSDLAARIKANEGKGGASKQPESAQAPDPVQEAYRRWQEAKGPWYMPTPQADSEIRRLESEYMQALQNSYRK